MRTVCRFAVGLDMSKPYKGSFVYRDAFFACGLRDRWHVTREGYVASVTFFCREGFIVLVATYCFRYIYYSTSEIKLQTFVLIYSVKIKLRQQFRRC